MARQFFYAAIIGCLLSTAAPAQSKVELRIQLGHSAGMFSTAFSPDGRSVLTGGFDNTARLWDVATGREIRRFEGHSDVVSDVAFSRDGRVVLTGSDDTARLWEMATGREIRRFESRPDEFTSVALSPDGRSVLSGGKGGTARLWDAATGREVRRFETNSDWVTDAAFSRDGRFFLTADDNGARLWEVATSREIRRFVGHSGRVTSIAFSPDDRSVLTGSADATARLWDVATGREITRFKGERDVTTVAFSPDSRSVLTGSLDGTTRLWEVATGREIRRFQGRTILISSVAFSPDGRSVLTAEPDTTWLWEVATGLEIRRFEGHAGPISSVAFSPDGRSVLTGSFGLKEQSEIWDLPTGREIRRFEGFRSGAFSPDGRFVIARRFDFTRRQYEGLQWEVVTGREIRRVEGVDSGVLSPDGRSIFVSGPDKTARLLDVVTGREIVRFEGHAERVESMAFSAGPFVLTGSADRTARLWDLANGREIRRFEGHTDTVIFVAFSPDGRFVLTGSHDKTARQWDLATGREIRRFEGHSDWVYSVALSPDAQFALTRSEDKTARQWDVATGREVRRFDGPGGHTGRIHSATFSFDNRLILTGGDDGTSKLWETATGRLLATLVSFRDGGWAVVDSEGRYDASNPDDSPGLYWLLGSKVIELKQLKDRFYSPALLARVLGFNRDPLPRVAGLDQLQSPPEVEVTPPAPGQSTATIRLTNDGGGIGRVIVKVNGREIAQSTRGPSINPDAVTAVLSVDLSAAELAADGQNTIEVIPYDKANLVAGRGPNRKWERLPAKPATPPVLHAIVAGVSNYENSSLNLTYPAKDAMDIAQALTVGGRRLFGVERVHISTFATGTSQEPTKDNIRLAFESVARSAGPNDVVLVYFAGHGVAGKAERDMYYYLTREARSFEFDNDAALREKTTISSAELLEWLRQKGMPLRQVVVLDTCAAGAAATELLKLAERRELTADQKRAIELLKDATGSHILMGSAADRVSYEASRYGQGLLTYALLLGMRGEALDEGGRLDVRKWFDTAQTRVPEFAQGIGGIQQPMISSPKGQTFPIALLTPDDRRQIPLSLLKPQLLRLQVLDANDADQLGLAAPARAALREASIPATRGETRREPALIYLDQVPDDVPDAYRPQIRYAVEAGGVQLSIRLLRGGQRLVERTVALPTRNVTEISQRAVAELIQMLATQRP